MNFLATHRPIAVLPFLSIVLCFNSSPALAQSGQLPATFVTASRVEQPVTDVVADVSVIDRSEIELMGAGTITDLLNRLHGVQSITGAHAASVYIRGADSRMTALYFDGVRVDTQDGAVRLGGGAPWELLSLSQIERVEVLRGP
ncbi:MAG: TonB-dependent receptor, partial [Hylemonella sp.]